MRRTCKQRRILARSALVLSLIAVAVPAKAQTNQFDQDIATLSGLIDALEKGRTMIIASHPPAMMVIERERVGGIAGWMVLSGQLHPDSAQSWARQQNGLSQGALAVMKKQLIELEAKRLAPPAPATPTPATPTTAATPPGATVWPTPMEWTKTKGGIHGTFLAECRGLRKDGLFALVLIGDSTVRGRFEEDPVINHYRVEGTILPDGTASGKSFKELPDPSDSSFAWTVRFSRSGNRLLMSSLSLDLLAAERGPNAILIDCKPGYMRQEQEE